MIRTWIYVGVAAALLAIAASWHLSRVRAAERAVHAHYTKVLSDISAKTAAAETAYRASENEWRDYFDKEAINGREKLSTARANAAAASAAGERVRAAFARYRAATSATKDTIAAQRSAGELGSGTPDLPTELFTRHTRELEQVGAFADELRIRGLSCERSADALTK